MLVTVSVLVATSRADAAPDISSSEYSLNTYLEGIRVAPAWEAGLLGSGVVVADLDTGILSTHVDILGTVVEGGYDFVNDDDEPDDDDDSITDGHGTASAGIIVGNWNATGIGGIAPSARILPVKIADSNVETTGSLIAAGVEFADNQPGVKIILIEAVNTPLNAAELASLQVAIANGKMIIAPAGNSATATPASPGSLFSLLGDAALVVGSHNGFERSIFSNGALGVADNYITAPGESVTVAGNRADDFYYRVSGTSMAAPQVAAAAALIWAYAPHLTNHEVAQILKETATDLHTSGVDDETGVGALNIEAALSPIGAIEVPTEDDTDDDENIDEDTESNDGSGSESEQEEGGSNNNENSSGGSGSGAGVALAALVVGGAGYALLQNNHDLENTLVLDKYGRTYELDLKTRVTIRDPGVSAGSVLKGLDNKTVDETLIKRSDFRLSARYVTSRTHGTWDNKVENIFDDLHSESIGMVITGTQVNGYRYALGYNSRPDEFYSLIPAKPGKTPYTLSFQSDAFDGPLQGYTSEGLHGALSYAPTSHWQTGLSFASLENDHNYGLESQSAAVHGSYRQERWGINLRLALLEEDGNLLGGASDGALSVDAADSLSASLSGYLELGTGWALLASYTEGLTDVDDRQNSLLHDFTRLHSNAWGIGLVGRNLLNTEDAYGIAWAQPLRTRAGSVEVSVPFARDTGGKIHRKVRRTSLVPSGSESSLELFYQVKLNRKTRLLTYLAYRTEPLHDFSAPSEMSFMTALEASF